MEEEEADNCQLRWLNWEIQKSAKGLAYTHVFACFLLDLLSPSFLSSPPLLDFSQVPNSPSSAMYVSLSFPSHPEW